MKKRSRYILAGVVVVLVAAMVGYRIIAGNAASSERRPTTPLVKVEKPLRQTVTLKRQFTGDMVAVRQATIFSRVSGNLERVYVDIGAPVRTGQLLALIDTTELHQTFQQAAATFENARMTYQRTKELAEQNLVAAQDIDNAEATMKVARANFETASTRLGYARITAPFSGYITKRSLDPGATVTPNNVTLFTLMDLDAMKVYVNILEKDIPLVKEGMKVVITVDAFPGREFNGVIARNSQAVDLSTRTMAVEIDVPNRDHTLKPGMFADVTLLVDQHPNAMTIPSQALFKDDNGNYVFVVSGDVARRIRVVVGAEQDSRIEILSGLRDTTSVITTGQQFVRDGGPVSIQSP